MTPPPPPPAILTDITNDAVSVNEVSTNTHPNKKKRKYNKTNNPPVNGRRMMFTYNNYTDEIIQKVQAFAHTNCKYMVYGKELGKGRELKDSNGNNIIGDDGSIQLAPPTPHLQGFMILKKVWRFKSIFKEIGNCHLESAKASSIRCANYSKKGSMDSDEFSDCGPGRETAHPDFGKDADYWEFGALDKSRLSELRDKVSDLDHMCSGVLQGIPLSQLALEAPSTFVRNYRGLGVLASYIVEPYKHYMPRGFWFQGNVGTGKSHSARMLFPGIFDKPCTKWWDGYTGERAVLLDDLKNTKLGHYLKRWADLYECTGEFKGGTTILRHFALVTTCNHPIEELFVEDDKQQVAAIVGRHYIINFTANPDSDPYYRRSHAALHPRMSSLPKPDGYDSWHYMVKVLYWMRTGYHPTVTCDIEVTPRVTEEDIEQAREYYNRVDKPTPSIDDFIPDEALIERQEEENQTK